MGLLPTAVILSRNCRALFSHQNFAFALGAYSSCAHLDFLLLPITTFLMTLLKDPMPALDPGRPADIIRGACALAGAAHVATGLAEPITGWHGANAFARPRPATTATAVVRIVKARGVEVLKAKSDRRQGPNLGNSRLPRVEYSDIRPSGASYASILELGACLYQQHCCHMS